MMILTISIYKFKNLKECINKFRVDKNVILFLI